VGKREENKEATREALRKSARKLIAEQGYEAATVRDIAAGAGVTERTFYRYFDGKEGLLAEETLGWVAVLEEAIRARPGSEPPLTSIERAMLTVTQQLTAEGAGAAPLWLFQDGRRTFQLLRRVAPRPLLRIEAAIAGALLARQGLKRAPGADVGAAELEAQVAARVAVAILRSALIRRAQLEAEGAAERPALGELVELGFSSVRAALGG